MVCTCFKMDVIQRVDNLPSGEKSLASWSQMSYRSKANEAWFFFSSKNGVGRLARFLIQKWKQQKSLWGAATPKFFLLRIGVSFLIRLKLAYISLCIWGVMPCPLHTVGGKLGKICRRAFGTQSCVWLVKNENQLR